MEVIARSDGNFTYKLLTIETDEDTGGPGPIYAIILQSFAMLIVMLLAIIGNILVIVAVLKFERLKTVANSFIVSLAFADLLVAVFVMPFNASQVLAGKWIFGRIVCDIFNGNDVLFSTASILHLCSISMDRYIAITDPFHYESKMTKRKVGLMLSCVWTAAVLISHGPVQLGWYTTPEERLNWNNRTDECNFVPNKAYCAISSSISFWIPSVIMLFVYAKIYKEARRQEKNIHSLTFQNGGGSPSSKQEQKRMKKEHKAAKTLGLIMGAFLACWVPFFLWYVSSSMCDTCHTPQIVVAILFWVGYFNSALNPLIYAFFNRDFRLAFIRLLRIKVTPPNRRLPRFACCCCCCPDRNIVGRRPSEMDSLYELRTVGQRLSVHSLDA